ncbi:uncharacterized protein LOC108928840 [Scleropages formosus]|uniref:uncharacterized protein LOC108928840 n=1 Tax=Scleropages formosus TaxID=113540 RepID=UPI0008780A2B|nr:uncharacterized protein LOC108928840 [Scleropages formosus]
MLASTRAVNEAIALCEQEELRISESIQRWKEILRSMRRPQGDPPREDVKTVTEGSDAHAEEEEEDEEVELLQRALEKALLVRSTSGAAKGTASVDRESRDGKGRNRATGRNHPTGQLVHKRPSVSQKDWNRGSRSNAVSVATGKGKEAARCCTVTGRAAAGRASIAAQTRVTEQRGERQLCSSENNKRPVSAPAAGNRCRRQMDLRRSLVARDLGRVATTCQPLSKDPVSVAGGKRTAPGDNEQSSPKDDVYETVLLLLLLLFP